MGSDITLSNADLPSSTLAYFNGDELAARCFIEKYAARDDASGQLTEILPSEMWNRVATAIASVEILEKRQIVQQQFFDLLSDFKFMPGGRILYGAGNKKRVTLTNCYFTRIKGDSIEEIFDWCKSAARTYSYGGGNGGDVGVLRPKGSPVNNSAGSSTGPVSFMELMSQTTGTIGQAGRRGALMISMPVSHPDIEDFVMIKQGNRTKVRYANISIKIDDAFMQAVKTGGMYHHNFTDHKGRNYPKDVKAEDLWDKIIGAAHSSAEPGLLFWDTIKRESPSEYCAPVEGTNPCWTGDTKIWTLNGPKTFQELYNAGVKDVEVLSLTKEGSLAFKWMRDIRLTKRNADLLAIRLDDGTVLRCTPNHKLIKVGGIEIEAKHLKPGDTISSVYRQESNRKRYVDLKYIHNGSNVFECEHKLVASHVAGREILPGEVVHHKDEDKKNNLPSNLEIMTSTAHRKHHMTGSGNPTIVYDTSLWPQMFKKGECEGSKNLNYRHDIKDEDLIEMRKNGMTILQIADKAQCSMYTVKKRLSETKHQSFMPANHVVKFVEALDVKEDVFNGTVDDTHKYYVMCETGAILSRNCGEQPLEHNGACTLGHMNLAKYVTDPFTTEANVDWVRLADDVGTAVRFLDDVVEYNIPLHAHREQAEQAKNTRRIGLGVTALADALVMLSVKYDSEMGVLFAQRFFEFIRDAAYSASTQLAAEKGSFPFFEADKHLERPFVQRLPSQIRESIKTNGLRNVCILTVAPVGSGSTLTQTSSGIEPIFALTYTRRSESLSKEKYSVVHPLVDKFHLANGRSPTDLDNKVFSLPDYFVVSHQIDPFFRVKMQATIQRYVDSAISGTINLPTDVSVQTIKDIYMHAWESGCKGMTVYREGSREGILITDTTKAPEPVAVRERPVVLQGQTHRVMTPNGNMYVTVNTHEAKPFEVFCFIGKSGGHTASFTEALGRLASVSLRNGVPLAEIVDQLSGIRGPESVLGPGGSITSVPDAISRVLGKYIDGSKMNDILAKRDVSVDCGKCGGQVVYENGCSHCSGCGDSKCS